MRRILIGAKLPVSLSEQVTQYAERNNMTKSSVVALAIAAFFGETLEALSVSSHVNPHRKVTNDQIKAIHQCLKENNDLPRRAIFREFRLSPRTYYRYCKKDTGETPIKGTRGRRARRIG